MLNKTLWYAIILSLCELFSLINGLSFTNNMPRLDVVIFGATGLTGKQTVIHMIDFAKKYQISSWGIAGRSEKKLNALLEEVATITGADLSNVKIIIADVGDDKSLENMCAQTKVLINCSGPYREYGEPVVKAAIRAKTDYVDVSGEPNFMEKMQLLYHNEARRAGVYIISACGFDSIPADMGVVFLRKNFYGTINSVRTYLSVYVPPEILSKSERPGIIGNGTWASVVYILANLYELTTLRQKLFSTPLPTLTPQLIPRTIHQKEGSNDYYVPFLDLDESVVRRTQRYRYDQQRERPIQFKEYFRTGTFSQSLAFLTTINYIYLMSQTESNRNALLKHPERYTENFISLQGPTDIVMNNTFFTFELIAEGWDDGTDIENIKPNKKVIAKVTGVNPAYGATCVALLSSAITLLQERTKMPGNGGVLTTGVAFENTNIIKKLHENNLKFEIIDTKRI